MVSKAKQNSTRKNLCLNSLNSNWFSLPKSLLMNMMFRKWELSKILWEKSTKTKAINKYSQRKTFYRTRHKMLLLQSTIQLQLYIKCQLSRCKNWTSSSKLPLSHNRQNWILHSNHLQPGPAQSWWWMGLNIKKTRLNKGMKNHL